MSDRVSAQVLIVEDEVEHADLLAEALKRPGHVCTIVHGVADAISELQGGVFDVIVTDLRMPESGGINGVEPDGANAGIVVLQHAKRLQPNAETVMVTAHGDAQTARAAFKEGVYDFIEKPVDLALFRELIGRAAEAVLLRHSVSDSPDAAGLVQHDGFQGIIAGSEPMRRLLDTVRAVSGSSIPVLITGESGTGKELIAQSVHRISQRKDKRFVAFNCAGQSESLIEDQLFGHTKGAFTGADGPREGVFEYADGGTLFLDEIGDMPLTMQAKLLRVLEAGEVIRLGTNAVSTVDVRLVSATNKDLEKAVKDGTFREDLYFRIKGATVHLPPLRDRREDIPRIAQHAATKFATEMGIEPPAFTDAALMRLTAYGWKGNVRELLNVVQNMVVRAISDGSAQMLDTRHIPEEIVSDGDDGEVSSGALGGSGDGSLAGASLHQIEKRAIRETLRLTAGNREQAAQMLGIGERTLYRKLKEYGLK